MTIRIAILTSLAAFAAASAAFADPCHDLAKKAEATGGVWPEAKPLPQRSVTLDGPWHSPGAREQSGDAPDFVVQSLSPADRARLQVEAKGDDLAEAYLSASAKAFDTAMARVDSGTDSGNIAVRVHRWAGADVYAVSAHDESWYDCQRSIALFYTGSDGKLHYAGAGNIGDCTARGDTEQGAMPVLIGGRFAYVDDMPDLTAVTSEVGLRQIVYRWQGDHLAPGCPLAYRYEVGYVLSDQDRPVNDSGVERPANVWDVWMRTAFTPWMAAYAEDTLAQDTRRAAQPVTASDDKAGYDSRIARLTAFAAGDAARLSRLRTAYDSLLAHKVVDPYQVVVPIAHNGQVYLLTFAQQMTSAVYPYIDLVLYTADDKPPHRLGNIVVERQTAKLLSVTVEAKTP